MAAVGEAAASAKCCIRIFFRLIWLFLPKAATKCCVEIHDYMCSTAKEMLSNMPVVRAFAR